MDGATGFGCECSVAGSTLLTLESSAGENGSLSVDAFGELAAEMSASVESRRMAFRRRTRVMRARRRRECREW